MLRVCNCSMQTAWIRRTTHDSTCPLSGAYPPNITTFTTAFSGGEQPVTVRDDIQRRLEAAALPDPHDERDVMNAPLLRTAADAIATLRADLVAMTDERLEYHRLNQCLATELIAANARADAATDALRKIIAQPSKPWPDSVAHSPDAYHRAVHATYCAMRFIAIKALAAAPDAAMTAREGTKLTNTRASITTVYKNQHIANNLEDALRAELAATNEANERFAIRNRKDMDHIFVLEQKLAAANEQNNAAEWLLTNIESSVSDYYNDSNVAYNAAIDAAMAAKGEK